MAQTIEDYVEAHESVIKLTGVTKVFDLGESKIQALGGIDSNGAENGVDFEVRSRDFVIIHGPSGCGKSTLLNMITGADDPTHGKVVVRGKNLASMDEDERGIYRSKKMGIIYQMSYWIKSLNAVENVALPLIIEGVKAKRAVERASSLLSELKIHKLAKQNPAQLSGGEQQKLGFARALITNPHIIIADEPTGNLDSAAADEIMRMLDTLNNDMKKTILLVTHNPAYWDLGTKRVEMKDGIIIKEVTHG